LTAALVVAFVILIAVPKLARGATAVLLAVLAFAFFGGYERLREGARKPFLIHSHMFSNGLLLSDIEAMNSEGVFARSGWAARGSADPLAVGQRVFRAQCSACHTIDGYQGIRRALPTFADLQAFAAADRPEEAESVFASECAGCHSDFTAAEMQELLPTADEMAEDPDSIHDLNEGMIAGALFLLQEMGEAYVETPKGTMVNTAALHSPYMPPFVGTDDEFDALVVYLSSLARGVERLPGPAISGGVE
jgi:mono/diheme cytochrome c family protein